MRSSAVALVALAAVTQVWANSPAPTPALEKRQAFPSGLDVSQIAANPSSFLSEASKLLTIPAAASVFSSVTADPAFASSLSEALVSQYGSSTANSYLSSAYKELASVTSSAASAQSTTSQSSSSSSNSNSAPSSIVPTVALSAVAAAGVALLFAAL
ncbi:hypothetical protein FA10DRAFT_269689 [Acaromyces ingoldii]|uniref:Uncharacterized protein n=1 Tax=Acaromyces ingoldii TaxID=215250 RepID=A0A316YD27_9BASI|nr:hypothetical protein FA10DRAFT_269689 [Acaromyces ingoldii]PWN87081.1 hypothetical protein FA10DRAFT_269689 [Acaromyces ingoldii]